jgi:membrane protease YdiL (CAAX protease family)
MPEDEVTPIDPVEPADPVDLLRPIDSAYSIDRIAPAPLAPRPVPPRGIAPVWHTFLLVLAIVAFSIWGAQRSDSGELNPLAPVHRVAPPAKSAGHANNAPVSEKSDRIRLLRYALSGILELIVVAWVALGLRLRKIPFRSLFGAWPRSLNDLTLEAGIAALFWICSMLILVVVALTWTLVQSQVYQHQLKNQSHAQSKSPSAKPESPQQQQAETVRQLMELAPANGFEIAAWGFLCLIVGFSEELVFRGYLQSQGIALLRNIPITVLLTSLVFGAAHGYQGFRGMCIITIYGALFSCITLLRRNLFPGMIAHAWHDFATGLLLALVRSAHLLDRLPISS